MLGMTLGIVLALSALVVVFAKGGEDHTFRYTPPDFSTPEGRRVRSIMIGILVFIVLVAYLLAFDNTANNQGYVLFAIFVVIAATGTTQLRRVVSRRKDHKDKR